MAAAIAAAIIYGAAYPATAVALRSFSPLAVAGLSCTLALVLVVGLAVAGVLPRPAVASLTWPRLSRLIVLALLGGILFITGVNIAVAITGPDDHRVRRTAVRRVRDAVRGPSARRTGPADDALRVRPGIPRDRAAG